MSTFTFEAGRIAIGIMGPWMLPTFQLLDRFEWDAALFPQGPAGRQTRYASVGFTIWKGTREPEVAWDVLKHMVSAEATTKMAKLGSDLPPQRSVARNTYPRATTPYEEEVFVRSMDFNVRLFPQELWWEDLYRRMLDELDAALTGRESVAEALAEAHQVTNAYLQRMYAEEGPLMKSQNKAAFFFLLPNFVGFLIFALGPVVVAAGMGFYRYQLASGAPVFIGLDNFADLVLFTKVDGGWVARDPYFWKYLGNTLFLMLNIPLAMVGSLLLAVLLNKELPGRIFFRTLFFIPHLCTGIAIYMVWKMLLTYEPNVGIINGLLWQVFGVLGIAPERARRAPARDG